MATAEITMREGVTVSTYYGAADGVPVVQIDTSEGTGRVRVNLNDGPAIWDGDAEIADAPAETARRQGAVADARQALADIDAVWAEYADVDADTDAERTYDCENAQLAVLPRLVDALRAIVDGQEGER